jgi:hypothetical protein
MILNQGIGVGRSAMPYVPEDQMAKASEEAAGLFGILEHIPTPGKVALFNNYRYQNTIMRGGFMDGAESFTRGQGKYRPFRSGSMIPEAMGDGRQFVGGVNIFGQTTRRGEKLAQAKKASRFKRSANVTEEFRSPTFKGFRKNSLTGNPRAFGRFHSTSVFGPSSEGFYAPHQGGGLAGVGNMLTRSKTRCSKV